MDLTELLSNSVWIDEEGFQSDPSLSAWDRFQIIWFLTSVFTMPRLSFLWFLFQSSGQEGLFAFFTAAEPLALFVWAIAPQWLVIDRILLYPGAPVLNHIAIVYNIMTMFRDCVLPVIQFFKATDDDEEEKSSETLFDRLKTYLSLFLEPIAIALGSALLPYPVRYVCFGVGLVLGHCWLFPYLAYLLLAGMLFTRLWWIFGQLRLWVMLLPLRKLKQY